MHGTVKRGLRECLLREIPLQFHRHLFSSRLRRWNLKIKRETGDGFNKGDELQVNMRRRYQFRLIPTFHGPNI